MNIFNLTGHVLRVTTRYTNIYPYNTEIEPIFEEGSNGTIIKTYKMKGGSVIELFWELAKFLNFSYILVTEVDGYGYLNASQYSIDLFIGGFGLVESRASIVNPTFVVGTAKLAVFLNHKLGISRENPFLRPFSSSLWISLLVIFFILNLVALFFGSFELSLYDVQFYFLALILQKGPPLKHRRTSLFIVFWTSWLTSYIIYTLYSSLIVSFKAADSGLIENLNQFASSNYKIFWDNKSGMNELITGIARNNQVMKRIYDKKLKSDIKFDNYPNAIKQIVNRPIGLLAEDINAIFWIQNLIGYFPCYLSPLKFRGNAYQWTMYMGKQSKYRPAINYGILKMDERGLSDRINKKWVPSNEQCLTRPEYIGVTLADSSNAFILVHFSILLSFFVLIIEKFL